MAESIQFIPLQKEWQENRQSVLDLHIRMFNDPKVRRWLWNETPTTDTEITKLIEQSFLASNALTLIIRVNELMAGEVGVDNIKNGVGRVGYVLDRPFWGRKIMSQALKYTIESCKNDGRARLLVATVFPDNGSSRRVLKKSRFNLVSKRLTPNKELVYNLLLT